MSTITSDNVVGTLPKGADVVVQTGPEGNDLVVAKKPVAKADFEVSGDTGFAGNTVSKSKVNVETQKGETTTIAVSATFKQTNIENEGQGSLKVNVVGSAFKKGTITGGKQSDQVSFDGNSSIQKAKLNLGKGNDSVIFNKGATLKGKTTCDLGKGGKDAVVIEDLEALGGKLVIKNFRKGDSITVNGKVYNYSDRKDLQKLPGIKLK